MSQSFEGVVAVARFNLRHEAEIARGFLEAEGIESFVRADDGGGAFGVPLSYTLDSFAEIFVAAEDAERARDILKDAGFDGAPEDEEPEEPRY
jgi:hypothetical protein